MSEKRNERKRYSSVLEMVRDVGEDEEYTEQLADYLGRREVVTSLVALRAARGLTQKELAERVGLSQSRISKIESSPDGMLDLRSLGAYAGVLGYDVEISLVPRGMTSVGRVKYHVLRIRSLVDGLVRRRLPGDRLGKEGWRHVSSMMGYLLHLLKGAGKARRPLNEGETRGIRLEVFDDVNEQERVGERRRVGSGNEAPVCP